MFRSESTLNLSVQLYSTYSLLFTTKIETIRKVSFVFLKATKIDFELGKGLDKLELTLTIESFLNIKLRFEPNKLILIIEPLLDIEL